MVLNNDLRHPAVLAREAAGLADLSGGRFELGLGAGYTCRPSTSAPACARPGGVRVAPVRVGAGAARPARRRDVASTVSTTRSAEERLEPAPAGRVPILIGGNGQRTQACAARHADALGLTGFCRAPRRHRDRRLVHHLRRPRRAGRPAPRADRRPGAAAAAAGARTVDRADEPPQEALERVAAALELPLEWVQRLAVRPRRHGGRDRGDPARAPRALRRLPLDALPRQARRAARRGAARLRRARRRRLGIGPARIGLSSAAKRRPRRGVRVIDCDVHIEIGDREEFLAYVEPGQRDWFRAHGRCSDCPATSGRTRSAGTATSSSAGRPASPRSHARGRRARGARRHGRRHRRPQRRLRRRRVADAVGLPRRRLRPRAQRLAARRVARRRPALPRLDPRARAGPGRRRPRDRPRCADDRASCRCCFGGSERPYGDPRYLPILEAAADSACRSPSTPAARASGSPRRPAAPGMPTFYIEWHTARLGRLDHGPPRLAALPRDFERCPGCGCC